MEFGPCRSVGGGEGGGEKNLTFFVSLGIAEILAILELLLIFKLPFSKPFKTICKDDYAKNGEPGAV